MSLIINGVPPQLVFGSKRDFGSMDWTERQAWLIAVGQQKGLKWDWQLWRWKD